MLRKEKFNKIITLALQALDANDQATPDLLKGIITENTKNAKEAHDKYIDAFCSALNGFIPAKAHVSYGWRETGETLFQNKLDDFAPLTRNNASEKFTSIIEKEYSTKDIANREARLISTLTTELNNFFRCNFTYNPLPEPYKKLKDKLIAACDSYTDEYTFFKNKHAYLANNTKVLLEAIDNVTNPQILDMEFFKLSALRKIFTCLKTFLISETSSKKFLEKIKQYQKESINDCNFPKCNVLCLKTFSIYIQNFLFTEHPDTSAANAARQLKEIFVIFHFGNPDLFAAQTESLKESSEDSSEEFSEQLRTRLASF